jgi:hypothetical protein
MDDSDNVSLFIGCLPGEEMRQIVVFPGGHVVADIREQEIETPMGDRLPDHGWSGAIALIGALSNTGGWYIEDVTDDANGWWLKPRKNTGMPGIRLRGLDVTPPIDGPKPEDWS